MYAKLFLSFASIVLAYHAEASLPGYINTCSLSDPKFNECTLRSARESLKEFSKGDTERNIPSMEPLFIKEIRAIGRKGDGLSVLLTDAKLYGCGNLDLKKFKIDTVNKKVLGKAVGDLLIDSTYEISGRILIIPLNGKGHALINLNATKITYGFDYELRKNKNGQEYVHMLTDYLKYDIGRASFNLENLFSGDKVLGESTNRLLNDSWKDIINDVGPPVAKILKDSFQKTIRKFLNGVTYEELFQP